MPYGTVNADVIQTSTTGGILGAGNASIMKNRIINGAMVIDQRNAGASINPATNNAYCVDRWLTNTNVASKYSVQQNAGSVTPPAGFTNYLGATSLSAYSVGSADSFALVQKIEGYNFADLNWGSANAKTVTLSFWVRSSLTGTFGGSITNSAINRSYPFTYTITTANTWEYETITIAGDTTGTWLTTNGIGAWVWFGLGMGSTLSGTAGSWAGAEYRSATGATSVVGTSGATFYITGVQLEVGTSATGFEYRMYGQELALCQRYLPALISSSTTDFISFGQASGTTNVYAIVQHIVTPRVAPTGITASGTTIVTASGIGNTTAITFTNGGIYASRINFAIAGVTSGITYGTYFNTSGATILFTGCEL